MSACSSLISPAIKLKRDNICHILSFCFPFCLDKDHAFALVCKEWNEAFKLFFNKIRAFISPRDLYSSTASESGQFDIIMSCCKIAIDVSTAPTFPDSPFYFDIVNVLARGHLLCYDLSTRGGPNDQTCYEMALKSFTIAAEAVLKNVSDDSEFELSPTIIAKSYEKFERTTKLLFFIFGIVERCHLKFHGFSSFESSARESFVVVFSERLPVAELRDSIDSITASSKIISSLEKVTIQNSEIKTSFVFLDAKNLEVFVVDSDHPIVKSSGLLGGMCRLLDQVIFSLYDMERKRTCSVLIHCALKIPILKEVMFFAEMNSIEPNGEIQKPLRSRFEDIVKPWCVSFIESLEQDILFELILAANLLDYPALLDCTSAKVASMIKGTSVEEIRRTFNIVNDFTPEEEEQIRAENKWCEED